MVRLEDAQTRHSDEEVTSGFDALDHARRGAANARRGGQVRRSRRVRLPGSPSRAWRRHRHTRAVTMMIAAATAVGVWITGAANHVWLVQSAA